MSAPKSDPRAKDHLRAVIKEYLVTDELLTEEKLLDLLVDAVTKSTDEQPRVVQLHVEGTRANRLYRTRSNALTEEDQAYLDEVDYFRTERP